jgi:hypothetical protein
VCSCYLKVPSRNVIIETALSQDNVATPNYWLQHCSQKRALRPESTSYLTFLSDEIPLPINLFFEAVNFDAEKKDMASSPGMLQQRSSHI